MMRTVKGAIDNYDLNIVDIDQISMMIMSNKSH